MARAYGQQLDFANANELAGRYTMANLLAPPERDTGAVEPTLDQIKAIVAERLAHPRPLSPGAKFWQGRAGFSAEDSQKWGLFGQIPNRYRPWMRGSNIAGYFTQAILTAQKPTAAEKRAQTIAATEDVIPGITAKLAAADEGQKHVGVNRTFGQGFQTVVQKVGTTALKTVSSGARVLGNAASVIPGIGTVAAYGLQFAGSVGQAVANGKNALSAAKSAAVSAALNSLPGGELTGALVKTVANVAAAGIDGQNMLKSARNEVVASAIGMIPNDQAQKVLQAAADAAIAGKNVLKGAEQGAINAALDQVPDSSARAAIRATLEGKSPADIVKGASKDLLARAAGALPTGGAAALVQGITGKSPTELHSLASGISPPVRDIMTSYTLQRAPTASPRPGIPRPSLIASIAPARSLQEGLNRLPRPTMGRAMIAHRPLTNRAKMFVRNKAGAIGNDVSGLTSDGKWLVQAGDTGSKIAKALTGDATRWKELIPLNPANMKNAADVKAAGFPVYTYKANPINIPASWVKPTVVSQPVPAAPVPSALPNIPANPLQTILTTVNTVLAPAGDIAAQGQARAILATWGKTDGANQAGLTDYGGLSEIGATSWSSRDVLQSASFQRWSNQSPTDGQWSQKLADALHAWAEQKAAQVLPGAGQPTTPSVTPTGANQQSGSQTPTTQAVPSFQLPQIAGQTPGVTVTPGTYAPGPGGGTITLPGLTVTPGTATTQSQADQKPSFWQENKKNLIPAGIGLLISYGSKFV
jgi:hypothetical protein